MVALAALMAGPAFAGCGLSDAIDVARLPPGPPAYAAESLKQSRELLPAAPSRPAVQIRASLDIAMIGGRQDLIAYRDRRGWRVDRRVQPGPRMTPDGAIPQVTVQHGRLSRAQSARLDGLMKAACLWRFPPWLPNTLPMKGGQDATCMDGATLVMEIRSDRRRWVGAQECQIQGPPGEIYNLLSQASDH